MKNLNKTFKIDPKITADQWQLYSFDDEPKLAAKSKLAARALNTALKKAVNNVDPSLPEVDQWNTVYKAVAVVMHRYSECGATDTEPRYVLADILDELFGRQ
jgi:hypothetical protein